MLPAGHGLRCGRSTAPRRIFEQPLRPSRRNRDPRRVTLGRRRAKGQQRTRRRRHRKRNAGATVKGVGDVDSTSLPTTSTCSTPPAWIIDEPTTRPYRKPAHAAARSNDPQRMPSLSPTNAPVWGSGCSGVQVATIRRSIASGVRPACLIAAQASTARLAVVSSGLAMRRSRMPVRSTIHSSVVSIRCSRSALVSRCSGRATPQPERQAA